MKSRICSKAVLVSKISRAHFSSFMYGTIPSRLKGPGFEYVDLRDYAHGDDVRFIDWRASARMLKPDGDYRLLVKEHLLERMVNIVFILDYSESMLYGDKVETAIYALSGLLSIASRVGDVVDLIILHGEKPVVRPGMDPLDAVNFALNVICRADPRGGTDLGKAVSYIKNARNREAVFLVTDYAHYPVEFEALASTINAVRTVMGAVLVSTPLEINVPGVGGYYTFIDVEKPGETLNIEINQYYRQVYRHMKKIKATLLKYGVENIDICGLEQAKIRKLMLIKLYSLSRARRRAS